MPLTLLRRSLRQGALAFEKFGEIDYALHSLPSSRTLFIDIDNKEDGRLNIRDVHSHLRIIGITPETVCYNRTRRGWHLVIVLEGVKLTELERISLQSIFGDDSMRSALNFMRYWHGKGKKIDRFWKSRSNILYQRKLV